MPGNTKAQLAYTRHKQEFKITLIFRPRLMPFSLFLPLNLLTLDGASASSAISPTLACARTAEAVVRVMPWHCWRSIACSSSDDIKGGSTDNNALASLGVLHLLKQQQWQWQWRRQRCLGIIGPPSLAYLHKDYGGNSVDDGALELSTIHRLHAQQ
jgi:hypothetical protein